MAAIDLTSGSASAYGSGELQLQGKVQMTTTPTPVTDNLNVASPLLLSTTLVQVTSTLKITTNDNPYIDAEDGTTNNRFTVGRDGSSQQVNVDFASNPTGSTTAVGAIRTYRDGTNLSEAMTFIEDGSVGIGTTAPVGLLDLYKAAAATRLAIRGDAGQNRLISYRTGAVQRFGLYVNNTAESGANAGSNFAIRAYSDAGTLLNTPLFIQRSTGNVGVNTTTPTQKLHVNGSLRLETGGIYDNSNNAGSLGQVLTPTLTGVTWKDLENTGKIRSLGGVIRNTGGTWSYINDADHEPLNLVSISQPNSYTVRVTYNKTYAKVITFICAPDEGYTENGIFMGASVGLGFADIRLYQTRNVNAYIYYDGSSWQAVGDIITGFTYVSGLLTFNHPRLYADAQYGLSATPRDGSAYNYYGGSQGETSSQIYIYNPDGTPYTGSENTNMKFFFGKSASGLLTNTQSAISGANVWLSGLMLDTL